MEKKVLGDKFSEIKNFLTQKKYFNSTSEETLAAQLRNFIYESSCRNEYVKFANKKLKEKKIDLNKNYDILIIGAGIHAAAFVYTVKKLDPNLHILILEKSSEISSTFHQLGDSLVLNSPTFSKVGLNSNIFQGHFIQTSDFDELSEKPFPTGKHLYQLAVMVLFHSDADILFNFDVKEITNEKKLRVISSKKEKIFSKNIILSNGMGANKKEPFKINRKSKKIISGDEFLSRSFKDKKFFEKIKKEKVAVIGAGDTANCVMEYLLPLVYPNYYYGFYRKDKFLPSFVYWFGKAPKTFKNIFLLINQDIATLVALLNSFGMKKPLLNSQLKCGKKQKN